MVFLIYHIRKLVINVVLGEEQAPSRWEGHPIDQSTTVNNDDQS